MTQPLLSIIIPAYNYAHTLERAVGSVLAQKDDNIEVIVINDGSTDSTSNVLSKLEQHSPDTFRAINQANRGLAGTRNRGIDESQGEYLMFLDADDELADNAISHLRQTIQTMTGVDMIIGAHLSVEPDGSERFRPRPAMSQTRQTAFKAICSTKHFR